MYQLCQHLFQRFCKFKAFFKHFFIDFPSVYKRGFSQRSCSNAKILVHLTKADSSLFTNLLQFPLLEIIVDINVDLPPTFLSITNAEKSITVNTSTTPTQSTQH